MTAHRAGLSVRQTRILRAIATVNELEQRPATIADLFAIDGAPTADVVRAVWALRSRFLVRVEGPRVSSLQRGRDLLASSYYRERGL